MFGFLLPIFCGALTFAGLAMVSGRTRDEAVGLAGFMMAGASAPVGAVVGAAVSAIGAPEAAGRRRWVAAAVLALVSMAIWGALIAT